MIEWRTVLIGLAIVAVFAVAIGARTYFGFRTTLSRLTLINRSQEAVSDARMRQDDRETALGAIGPGQRGSTDFIAREGSLTLVVKFSSGRTLSAENVGYLAGGLPATVFFEVTDNDVRLLSIVSRNANPYSGR